MGKALWKMGWGLTAALVLAACTSAPPNSQAQGPGSAANAVAAVKLPEWVTNPPVTEDEDYVFVSSGTSSTGGLGEAEKNASQDLKDQITTYIGVKVSVATSATARGSLDSYRANVEQSVLAESKAQIAGLRVAERFPVQRGTSITLYIKALYKKDDLDKEKARISALFAEVEDAVAKPEKKGDQLAAAGHYMEAVDQYLAAVTAATGPEVENAQIKLDRNLSKVQTLLGQITLKTVGQDQVTQIGVPFASPFEVQAVYSSQGTEVPLVGADLRFNYKVKKNGRVVMTGTNIKTNAEGLASFAFPVPDFAARDSVIVLLDVNPYLERLAALPKTQQVKVTVLEDLAARSRVSIGYKVESEAKTIPLALAVLEMDDGAVPLKSAVLAPAVQEVLTTAGFNLSMVSGFDPVRLRSLDDAGVQTALKTTLGAETPRFAYGTAAVSEITQEGKIFTARATATLKVFDRVSNKLIYVQTRSKRAVGSDKASATKAALAQLGQELGQSLADELP